jgi:hypothetical protein
MLLGVALLVAIRLVLSRRGIRASLRSSLVAAAVGSVAYPLLVCTFMGIGGAMAVRDQHRWYRFKFAFSTYAEAAPSDSIPRGAVMGVFVLACHDLLRQRTKPNGPGRPPGLTGPMDPPTPGGRS